MPAWCTDITQKSHWMVMISQNLVLLLLHPLLLTGQASEAEKAHLACAPFGS